MGGGRTTIERAERVVEAAEEDPEEYGPLVAQMDRTSNVARAYRSLVVQQQAKEIEAEPPALPQGPFRVVVADPPWRYPGRNTVPYPTLDMDAIKALPVGSIAMPDAALWLWTTNTHLPRAFEVVSALGFE